MMDGGNNMVEVAPEGLSEDIVIEILLRLPVKSLLRFKTVCKSWNLIISSTWFIREHLKLAHAARYNQHKDFLGILNAVLFKDDSDGLMLAKEFDVPTENFVGSEEIWARISCDGLICFQTEHANTVVIWNPSLPTECKLIDSDFVVSCGIGYDPCTDDYKIVGLPCISFDESPCAYISVQLFSLKRGSWRTLRMTKTMDFEILNTKVTYTKNRLYWLGISEDEDEDEDWTYFIVYFDLVEEV